MICFVWRCQHPSDQLWLTDVLQTCFRFISDGGGKNLTHFKVTATFYFFCSPIVLVFFFHVNFLLPSPSLSRASPAQTTRGCQQAAADSPLVFLSRLSLCSDSGSHRHGERPRSVLLCWAHSRFITRRSHTSQSAVESLPHARPVSPGLQEVLRGRDLGRRIYFCIMPLTHAFIMFCFTWNTSFPPSNAHSLFLPLLCSPKHSDITSYCEPDVVNQTARWGQPAEVWLLGFRWRNPYARIFEESLQTQCFSQTENQLEVGAATRGPWSTAVQLISCQSWTGKMQIMTSTRGKALSAVLSLYDSTDSTTLPPPLS